MQSESPMAMTSRWMGSSPVALPGPPAGPCSPAPAVSADDADHDRPEQDPWRVERLLAVQGLAAQAGGANNAIMQD